MSPSDAYKPPFGSAVNCINNTGDPDQSRLEWRAVSPLSTGSGNWLLLAYATGGHDLGSSEVSTSEGGMNCHIGNPG